MNKKALIFAVSLVFMTLAALIAGFYLVVLLIFINKIALYSKRNLALLWSYFFYHFML